MPTQRRLSDSTPRNQMNDFYLQQQPSQSEEYALIGTSSFFETTTTNTATATSMTTPTAGRSALPSLHAKPTKAGAVQKEVARNEKETKRNHGNGGPTNAQPSSLYSLNSNTNNNVNDNNTTNGSSFYELSENFKANNSNYKLSAPASRNGMDWGALEDGGGLGSAYYLPTTTTTTKTKSKTNSSQKGLNSVASVGDLIYNCDNSAKKNDKRSTSSTAPAVDMDAVMDALHPTHPNASHGGDSNSSDSDSGSTSTDNSSNTRSTDEEEGEKEGKDFLYYYVTDAPPPPTQQEQEEVIPASAADPQTAHVARLIIQNMQLIRATQAAPKVQQHVQVQPFYVPTAQQNSQYKLEKMQQLFQFRLEDVEWVDSPRWDEMTAKEEKEKRKKRQKERVNQYGETDKEFMRRVFYYPPPPPPPPSTHYDYPHRHYHNFSESDSYTDDDDDAYYNEKRKQQRHHRRRARNANSSSEEDRRGSRSCYSDDEDDERYKARSGGKRVSSRSSGKRKKRVSRR